MKTILLLIFFCISSMVFGKNEVVITGVINAEKVKKIIIPVKKKTRMKQPKTMLAFEYYYTVDWLYAETPFSHKLDAYV